MAVRSTPRKKLAGPFDAIGAVSSVDAGNARDRLVLGNLAFVVSVAREYRGLGLAFEDLVGDGTIGLIEAADRFDPERGVKFITYATWWVRKRILEAITDRGHLVRVPAGRMRRYRAILDAERRLTSELGRRPDRAELRTASGETTTAIDEATTLGRRQASIAPRDEDGEALDPLARLEAPDSTAAIERLLADEDRDVLRESLADLAPRERAVIALRYGFTQEGDRTLKEIGARLDLSREGVRQIERRASRRIRRAVRRRHARP